MEKFINPPISPTNLPCPLFCKEGKSFSKGGFEVTHSKTGRAK